MNWEGGHPRQVAASLVGWDQTQETSLLPVIAALPPSTFASGLIRADNPLIVVFAQFLMDLSSCPDLCVDMPEVRAPCQPIQPTCCCLPRGSGAPDRPQKPREPEALKRCPVNKYRQMTQSWVAESR